MRFLTAIIVTFYIGIINQVWAQQESTIQNDAAVKLCDRLTANPNDPNRMSDGVLLEKIQAPKALPICKKALEADPENLRIQYQIGRIYVSQFDYKNALIYLNKAAAGRYAAAYVAIAVIQVSTSKEKNEDALLNLVRAQTLGMSSASVLIDEMVQNQLVTSRSLESARRIAQAELSEKVKSIASSVQSQPVKSADSNTQKTQSVTETEQINWLLGVNVNKLFFSGDYSISEKLDNKYGCIGYLAKIDLLSNQDKELLFEKKAISDQLKICDQIISNSEKFRISKNSPEFQELLYQKAILKKMINDRSGVADLEELNNFSRYDEDLSYPIFQLLTWEFDEKYLAQIEKFRPLKDSALACYISDRYLERGKFSEAKQELAKYVVNLLKTTEGGGEISTDNFDLTGEIDFQLLFQLQLPGNMSSTQANKSLFQKKYQMLVNKLYLARVSTGCNIPFQISRILSQENPNGDYKRFIEIAVIIESALNDLYVRNGFNIPAGHLGYRTDMGRPERFFSSRTAIVKKFIQNESATIDFLKSKEKIAPLVTNKSIASFQTIASYVQTNKIEKKFSINGRWVVDAFNPGICDIEGIEIKENKIRIDQSWCDIKSLEVTPRVSLNPDIIAKCKMEPSFKNDRFSCNDPIENNVVRIDSIVSFSCGEGGNARQGLIGFLINRDTGDGNAVSFPNFFQNQYSKVALKVCK